jgi:hypothetical protein
MLKRTVLIFGVLSAVFLIGCGKTETTNNSNSTAMDSNKNTSKTTTTTTSSTTTSNEKIGVPECDDFIAKYESCTDKVPEAGRAQYKDALAQWRKSWKQLAANPATKGTLAAACKQAAESSAASWKAYGCAQ